MAERDIPVVSLTPPGCNAGSPGGALNLDSLVGKLGDDPENSATTPPRQAYCYVPSVESPLYDPEVLVEHLKKEVKSITTCYQMELVESKRLRAGTASVAEEKRVLAAEQRALYDRAVGVLCAQEMDTRALIANLAGEGAATIAGLALSSEPRPRVQGGGAAAPEAESHTEIMALRRELGRLRTHAVACESLARVFAPTSYMEEYRREAVLRAESETRCINLERSIIALEAEVSSLRSECESLRHDPTYAAPPAPVSPSGASPTRRGSDYAFPAIPRVQSLHQSTNEATAALLRRSGSNTGKTRDTFARSSSTPPATTPAKRRAAGSRNATSTALAATSEAPAAGLPGPAPAPAPAAAPPPQTSEKRRTRHSGGHVTPRSGGTSVRSGRQATPKASPKPRASTPNPAKGGSSTPKMTPASAPHSRGSSPARERRAQSPAFSHGRVYNTRSRNGNSRTHAPVASPRVTVMQRIMTPDYLLTSSEKRKPVIVRGKVSERS
eukprot:Rhum_TRINITY_DN11512_c0_g1::Rhum_TRINITY_DN11512_c0_g1_i1::g.45125::m.45125